MSNPMQALMSNPMQLLDHGLIMGGGLIYNFTSKPLENGYCRFELMCDGLGEIATAKFHAFLPRTGKITLDLIHTHTPRLLKVLPITLSYLVITSPLALSKAFVREAAMVVLATTIAANFKASKQVKPAHEGTVRILQGFALAILCKGTIQALDNLIHGNLMGSAMTVAGMQLISVLPFAVARFLQYTDEAAAQEKMNKKEGKEIEDGNKGVVWTDLPPGEPDSTPLYSGTSPLPPRAGVVQSGTPGATAASSASPGPVPHWVSSPKYPAPIADPPAQGAPAVRGSSLRSLASSTASLASTSEEYAAAASRAARGDGASRSMGGQ